MHAVDTVILIGTVGGDPEVRKTGGGTAVTNFSVATNESFKDREGNRQEQTEWHG
jgi:single-strand DNA-binding protein